jgi:hypothetical protein
MVSFLGLFSLQGISLMPGPRYPMCRTPPPPYTDIGAREGWHPSSLQGKREEIKRKCWLLQSVAQGTVTDAQETGRRHTSTLPSRDPPNAADKSPFTRERHPRALRQTQGVHAMPQTTIGNLPATHRLPPINFQIHTLDFTIRTWAHDPEIFQFVS